MKLRKVLSLFVALVMMFEVLPLSSLATEIADATENVEVSAEAVEETVEEVVEEESAVLLGATADETEEDSSDESGIATVSDDDTILAYGDGWSLSSDGVLTIEKSMTNRYAVDEYQENIPWYSYIDSITSVVVCEGVTSICDYAFINCYALTDVTLPSTLTQIGYAAFAFCYSLMQITLPDGLILFRGYITGYNGTATFKYCGLTSIAIPDGISSIDSYQFQQCSNLTSINIPSSVTSIQTKAFDGCKKLTDVYYDGTVSEWNAISISSSGNSYLLSATIHCSNGTISPYFTNGYGTEESPYQVATAEQLDAVRYDLTACYIQVADIDLSGIEWVPIGYSSSSQEYESFSGQYDGNYHTITGMTVEITSKNSECFGLFSESTNTETVLRNIVLVSVSISIDGNDCDHIYVGGVIGSCAGTISDCEVSGEISVYGVRDATIGGLAGLGGSCTHCTNYANVYVESSTFSTYHVVECGGICGEVQANSEIIYSINYGDITVLATEPICGGITGYSNGTLNYCVNYGNVYGEADWRWNNVSSSCHCNAGGISGSVSNGESNNCINFGNVYAYETSDNCSCTAGGIAGSIGGGFSASSAAISNCYNLGNEICSNSSEDYETFAGRVSGKIVLSTSSCYSIDTATVNGVTPAESDTGASTIHGESMSEAEIASAIKPILDELGLEYDYSYSGSYGSVYYLISYNGETGVLELGGNLYDVYVLGDDVDTTGISDMVGSFVMITKEQDEDNVLNYTVTSIVQVESAIGEVTEQGSSTLTIDGTTYPVRDDYILGSYEGDELLYHVYDGTIVGYSLPETSTGTLDEWDNTASTVTIDGTVYPVLSVTDLSFLANVDTYLGKEVTLVTYEVSGYTIVGSISHTPVTEFSFYSTTSTGFIGLGTTKGMFISYLVDGEIDVKFNEFIIVVDDDSIIEVTPVEWYDDYGMLYSITAKSVGTANLTVTNALNGDSATLTITVFKDELVYRFDEVPERTYEEGKTTNFYDYNGMVVDEFKYTPHKDSDGNIEYYTVTMTIYNTLDLYGMVVSYDSQGNPQGYYVIDKKDAVESSLADNLEELWNATGDLFYWFQNNHYYSGESISKKTEVELTVPAGGYLEISNNANNELVALANVVGLVIDTIKLAYDEVSGLDDEAKTIADILTENIVEKQVLKTVKKTVVNELKDIDWYDSYCIEVLFDKLEEMGIDLFDAIKKKISAKTGVSIAESAVNKIIPTGRVIDALWTFTDALELIAHWAMLDGSTGFSSGIYLYSPSNGSSINSNAVSVTSSNSNVTIHAYLVVDSDEVEVTNQTITDSTYEIYSITMYKDGEVTQPDSTVSVKIPITETFESVDSSTLKVYRVNDDGTITDMNATVVDGYLVFETNHFSYYAVVGNEIDKDAELIAEAETTLSSTDWTLAQSDVESATGSTTADKIATLIDAILAGLGIDDSVTVTYTITDITEAIAGDATDVDGTDGSFTINFTISAGNESDTLTETGTITATEYVHTHSLTHFEAVEATCGNGGNPEYWYCADCGKYYSDENAENEITQEDTVITTTDHTYGEPEWTWTWSETEQTYTVTAKFTCTVCGGTDTETALVTSETTDATCTATGSTVYTAVVDMDGTAYSDTKTVELPMVAHTEGEAVTENEVAATCTTDGSYDNVIYCTVCNEELSRETITVPATGHTEGEAVTENEVAATCTTDGSYDTVVYCTICNEELSRETVTVPATGHTTEIQNAVEATCTEDGYTGDEVCTVCGETITVGTVIPATGHSFNSEGVCEACGAKTGEDGTASSVTVESDDTIFANVLPSGLVTSATISISNDNGGTLVVSSVVEISAYPYLVEHIADTLSFTLYNESQGDDLISDTNSFTITTTENNKKTLKKVSILFYGDVDYSGTGTSTVTMDFASASDLSSSDIYVLHYTGSYPTWEVVASTVTFGEAITVEFEASDYSPFVVLSVASASSGGSSSMIDILLRISANYSEVNEAITRANALNPADYVDFSAVTEAINAVNWNLKAINQLTVNAYADAINTAIDNLVKTTATITEETVNIDEPIEDTNTDTEDDDDESSETSEPETNPTTGIAISILPMMIAALAAASAKRR
ncbi:MAG: leucine-rich repeat domain-containing protein [Oscillospiraceae bacterium]|nr:leucine-rich repeat domain-containing protein [Oscillospiraceae bacterium]